MIPIRTQTDASSQTDTRNVSTGIRRRRLDRSDSTSPGKRNILLQWALATVCLAVALFTGQQLARAQTSYPMLMSLKPVAVPLGQTAELTVQSRYDLAGAYAVVVSGSGVKAEPVLPEPKDGKPVTNLTSLKLRVTAEPDAVPGVRDFRVVTPRGISTVGQLVVTPHSVYSEKSANNSAEQAEQVSLPATLCGAIEANEDVDFFRFHAEEGQRFCFHVRAMRLQNRIHDLQAHVDPILTLRNENGSTVATNDNKFFADPLLCHTVTTTGDYTLEIRDVRYQGNKYWEYSIECGLEPLVVAVHPLAINTSQTDQAQAVPITGETGAAGGAAQPRKLKLLADPVNGVADAVVVSEDRESNPIDVVVSKHPVQVESAQANDSIEDAAAIPVPCTIAGRIEAAADLDYFAFEAKKGETFSVRVTARQLQSELDSIVRILDGNGKSLVENDDLNRYRHKFADSWIEHWSAPSDGTFYIEIRDLHLRGGPEFAYAMDVEKSEPTFELYLDTDKTQLTPGTSGVVFVNAVRKNGFTGPISLDVSGLPKGVSAECGIILADRRDGCIILTAEPDAKLDYSIMTVTGHASVGEGDAARQIDQTAVVYQETYQPGGGRGHWPVDHHAVAVNEPSDVRAVKLNTYDVSLKPGETAQIEVEIERAEGFEKNVQLDMLFRHLNSVYADTLPPGVSIDANQSRTLLTSKNSTGLIVIKADPKAAPVERQLVSVMANVSLNFVMKATYSSPPLRVTVLPQP